eukprot:GHRR01034587.1.p1 GENE.GHRR01034587.1~~GHRR01034587.1.p1  ORF type:complete len:135 (+),score=38.81 GHRR01034587.1:339-743(+)
MASFCMPHGAGATQQLPKHYASCLYRLRGSNYPDSDWWQYSRTKLANLMTGKEMGRRLQGTDVEVFVAHPGITKTEHYLKGGFGTKKSTSTIDTIVNYLATEPSTGAKPLMFAATELRIKGELESVLHVLTCSS